ncbi:complement factor H-like isoform X8 [Electrophorus electricus]|uniref:complement factor H-like isoform X8 n=1 Tax=Electrophorus electricus TaxID=8005 RepID=UPI0015D0111C|nr:complement factor H-like isoform X8 [Electrophorus electricus]
MQSRYHKRPQKFQSCHHLKGLKSRMQMVAKNVLVVLLVCSFTLAQSKDIKCLPPQILFGTIIEPQEEYQENELIKYACDKGYKATPGTPKCTKNGWSIKPECEEVTCVLQFGIPGVHSTSPSGKNIFKPEESLTLTCRKDHWILGTRLNSQIIKCKDNGEWERSPICNDITCNVPHDENLAHPFYYFSGDKKLGDTKFYECNYNYRKTASYATCTIDGWSPRTLCTKMTCPECIHGYQKTASRATCTIDGWSPRTLCTKMTCPEPEIAHAEILRPKDTYTIGDRITIQCFPGYEPVSSFVITCKRQQKWENMKRCTLAKGACGKLTLTNGFIQYSKDHDGAQRASYSCDTGYKAFDEKWWGVVTCQQGVWSHQPQCIRKNECGSLPNVKHGKQIQINEAHQDGQRLKIECDLGYKSRLSSIRCLNGQWETSVCEQVTCVLEFGIPGLHSTSPSGKNIFKPGESLTLTCRKDHWILGTRLSSQIIKCKDNGEWERSPICNEITCNVPHDENVAHPFYYFSGDKKLGDTKFYECNYNYRKTASYATCTIDGWSPRTLCTKMTCPEPEIAHAEILRPKDTYTIGDRIRIQCLPGYEPVSSFVITCKRQQKWENMKRCTRLRCDTPPKVENAIITSHSTELEMEQSVTFKCGEGFELHGHDTILCINSKWEQAPTCKHTVVEAAAPAGT